MAISKAEKTFMEAKLSVSIADILASVLAVKDILGQAYTRVNGSSVEVVFGNIKTKVDLRDPVAGIKIKQAASEAIDDAYVVNKVYTKWRKLVSDMNLNEVVEKYQDLRALAKSLFLYRGGNGVVKLQAAKRLRASDDNFLNFLTSSAKKLGFRVLSTNKMGNALSRYYALYLSYKDVGSFDIGVKTSPVSKVLQLDYKFRGKVSDTVYSLAGLHLTDRNGSGMNSSDLESELELAAQTKDVLKKSLDMIDDYKEAVNKLADLCKIIQKGI